MKKFLLFYVLLLVLAACDVFKRQQAIMPDSDRQVVTDSGTAPVNVSQAALPEPVYAFLNKHFPGDSVVGFETDNDYGVLEYNVMLSDGTEVDFDRNNQWKEVACTDKAVPTELVPAAIANYVKANHKSVPIIKIENKRFGYEIELSNEIKLKFNANCEFVGFNE